MKVLIDSPLSAVPTKPMVSPSGSFSSRVLPNQMPGSTVLLRFQPFSPGQSLRGGLAVFHCPAGWLQPPHTLSRASVFLSPLSNGATPAMLDCPISRKMCKVGPPPDSFPPVPALTPPVASAPPALAPTPPEPTLPPLEGAPPLPARVPPVPKPPPPPL